MIYIFTALYCEAQSLISCYHLTKATGITKFQVFTNEEEGLCLTVTGTGNIAAAVAVTNVCTVFGAGKNDFLINYGICAGKSGEKNICLGEIFLCNELVEESTCRVFYPDIIYKHDFREAEIITGENVAETLMSEVRGKNIVLYDMEASAVYQAGAYFFAPHQMSFLKVVSDYGDTSSVTKEKVSQLTDKHLEEIASYIARLRQVQKESELGGALDENTMKLFYKLCEDMHCSKVMEQSLMQHLKYCVLADMDYHKAVEEMYREEKLPCRDKREGKKCLEELKQRLL
ncbi:MAG: hypothetical protein J5981_05540 [Lachnospira sp.]|nr:hypothetical protein [Lachnospira sp.]